MRYNFDFVGKRKGFLTLSLVLVALTLVMVFTKGFNLGVDFTGGIEISVTVSDLEMSVGEMRGLLSSVNPIFESARIIKQKPLTQEGSSDQLARFSIVVNSENEQGLKEDIIKALTSKGVKSSNILSVNRISGFAAQEIKGYAWTAVIVAVALILLYITIRFRFSFGIGAIIALVHDILITLGFYSIFGIEINAPVVAALLTLLGYSLNDTIVVYDRVRENLRKLRGKSIEEIVNRSINEVIVRSLNTSLTTFTAVLMLFIFSGEVLRPFAFGIMVGVVVGTYSSLHIAAPVVITWLGRSKVKIK
ncbi:protein translocase subunit SecF [Kosmotoga olearia]|uniref:Protein-export membrane protein SecF n=1 Tax=Kosmotoga olearia (strain ATCC BAA-1733 / DSM 21960 / TBF 19.5.1) TaxID=521045 RepID=C5CF37_KOSOT|nr:protein translocase subunit SecF [Kosmotoga olearia]ACR80302.1 protein-export membrane protein SecF [Kosmotoga olearia TBF 19.5.1]